MVRLCCLHQGIWVDIECSAGIIPPYHLSRSQHRYKFMAVVLDFGQVQLVNRCVHRHLCSTRCCAGYPDVSILCRLVYSWYKVE